MNLMLATLLAMQSFTAAPVTPDAARIATMREDARADNTEVKACALMRQDLGAWTLAQSRRIDEASRDHPGGRGYLDAGIAKYSYYCFVDYNGWIDSEFRRIYHAQTPSEANCRIVAERASREIARFTTGVLDGKYIPRTLPFSGSSKEFMFASMCDARQDKEDRYQAITGMAHEVLVRRTWDCPNGLKLTTIAGNEKLRPISVERVTYSVIDEDRAGIRGLTCTDARRRLDPVKLRGWDEHARRNTMNGLAYDRTGPIIARAISMMRDYSARLKAMSDDQCIATGREGILAVNTIIDPVVFLSNNMLDH